MATASEMNRNKILKEENKKINKLIDEESGKQNSLLKEQAELKKIIMGIENERNKVKIEAEKSEILVFNLLNDDDIYNL